MSQQGLVYIEFTGIARLFFKKLYFFRYNSFLLFCTGSPLYFCEFLLKYNIAQYNIAQYFLWQMKTFPLGCSQLPSGLFWQNLFLRPAGLISPGLILAKSLAAPRWSDIPGAYFDRISFCAPLVRYPRGLFWKNLFLRPAVLISPGLILTESLSAPRWSEIPGAYSDKISFCAPMSQYRRGLLRQNPYLRPDIPVSTGLITAKSLSVPRCTKVEGIIDLILSHIPAFASSAGYR